MLEAIIGLGVIGVLLLAGFWWTRGGGGMPGGLDDPASNVQIGLTARGRLWPEDDRPDQPAGEPAPVEADEQAWQHERKRRERDQRS